MQQSVKYAVTATISGLKNASRIKQLLNSKRWLVWWPKMSSAQSETVTNRGLKTHLKKVR